MDATAMEQKSVSSAYCSCGQLTVATTGEPAPMGGLFRGDRSRAPLLQPRFFAWSSGSAMPQRATTSEESSR